MTSSVRRWLEQFGLSRYAEAFESNDIDLGLLGRVTDQTLKDLGVASAGHRLRILEAIETLTAPAAGAASTQRSPAPNPDQPERASPPAERRQLTVLFCDLVGSTELSRALDPEEYREVVQAYQTASAEAIGRYDGYVAQYLGDGMLIYFGYPKAHEDDAQRAIRSGLELIDAVSRLTLPSGPLSVRAGIHTGLVVMGDVGTGTAQEQLALGDTPNIAARLQGIAQPGSVVLSERTRQLAAGSFEYSDLGAHRLKGIAQPLQAWRANAQSKAASRFDAAAGRTPALMVGRDLEFAVLMHAWGRAKSGKGQLVLLCGEPGIGKSRILRALREKLSEEGIAAWHYQCSPYFVNSSLYPVIDNLERALRFEREDSPERRLDKLQQFLQAFGRPSLDSNLLGRLLSLPAEGRYGHLSMTPQKQKDETIRALNDIVAAAAKDKSMVMLFEDLHWSDATTLESLEALLGGLSRVPVLIVATHRPEFRPPWIGQQLVTALTLSRLDAEQTQALARRTAAGRELPKEIAEQIVAKTDGIPLFVEELTKTILESGLLKDEGGRYELSAPLPAFAIPTTLRDSLMARLDRLAPVKEVAQIGACIGREFSEELLSLISPMPKLQLSVALEQLLAAELVQKKRPSPDATYSFKHALIQEAAYDSLLRSQRAQFHARIAEALQSHFPEISDAEPEVLALHFAEGGNIERAARYWLRAGQNNVRRSANEQAIGYFEKALAATSQLPSSEPIERLELEIQLAYIPALMAVVGFAEPTTLAAVDRAFALGEKFGFGSSALPVLFGQFSYRMASASVVPGLEIAGRIVQLGNETGDDTVRMVGQRAVGFCNLWMGHLDVAQHSLEAALRLSENMEHRSLAFQLGHDPAITARAFYGVLKLKRGFPKQGRALLAEARDAAWTSGHALTIGYSLYEQAIFDSLTSDYAALDKTSSAFLDVCEKHRILQWRPLATFYRSWALWRMGEGVGLTDLEGLVNQQMGGTLQLGLPLSILMLADAYAQERNVAMAKHWANEGLATSARTAENWLLPEIYLVKASIAAGDERQRWLAASLEIAVKQHARFSELRATMALARLLAEQGKPADARALLHPIYDWFTEGFETKDLQEATALLEGLRA